MPIEDLKTKGDLAAFVSDQLAAAPARSIKKGSVAGLDALSTPTPWVPVLFEDGWGQFGEASYSQAAFRVEPAGKVQLRGIVAGGEGPGSVIFTLPPNLAPSHHQVYLASEFAGPARVDVRSTGEVVFQGASNPSSYLGLDPICFWPGV